MKSIFLFFLLLLFLGKCFSQPLNSKEIDPELFIQDLLNNQNLPDNYEEVYDHLYNYYQTPLDLNKAERNDLEGLYVLSVDEINQFLTYRSKYGALISVYELQAIPGWEIATIRKILPFITVKEGFEFKKLLERFSKNNSHYLIVRMDRTIQQKKGYRKTVDGEKIYQGAPTKFLIRYKNSIGKDFSVGVTMEKDQGEEMIWNPSAKNYLMDYISLHAFVFNKKRWKVIGVGDYKVQFGQGLVFGGGFGMGKGAETILSIKRNSIGIMPYGSVMESDFFRGICFTYSIHKNIDVTSLYSTNNRDASLGYDTLEHRYSVSSFTNYGMHRTRSELKAKGNVNEQVGGGNVSFISTSKRLKVGLSYVNTVFNIPVYEADRLYNRYDFNGNKNDVISTDFSLVYQNFIVFGESALSSNKAKAVVIGGLGSLSSKIDFSFLYRNYEKNFHSFYGNSFSEGSTNANEKGSYWGLKLKLHHKLAINAYYDRFTFPWLKYFKDSPSNGYGYMARVNYTPSRKILLYFQMRYEEVGKNQSDNYTPIDFVVPTHKYNYMIHKDCKAGVLSLRSRIQWSTYRQSNGSTNGLAIVQDISINLKKIKLILEINLKNRILR